MYLSFIGLLGFIGFAALSFWRFYSPVHLMEAKTVFIAPGTAKVKILQQLASEGLAPPRYMMLLPLLSLKTQNLKAGEYVFEGEVTPYHVLNIIAAGRVIAHKFTLPEGWNSRQLQEALLAEPKLTGEVPPLTEGYYLPETYHFTRGESRAALLARMQQAMQEAIASNWPNRAHNLPINTIEEAIILASIIERETGLAEERGLVASVYTNRLRAGMPLQADPTVAYGIEQALGNAMQRPLTRADLRKDSPWNTYTRRGLPQTAIANPGLDSLKAALNPPDSPYFYFVATGTGGHIFAESLQAHNRNVAAYRAQLRAQKK